MTAKAVHTVPQLIDAIQQAYQEGFEDARDLSAVGSIVHRPETIKMMWDYSVSAKYAREHHAAIMADAEAKQ